MHPILFRIPLPQRPLSLWWALAVVAVIAAGYGVYELLRGTKQSALGAAVVAIAAAAAGFVWRGTTFEAANLPIYSYGVMLGCSLVVGWYLTLTLCERDGMPRETMANCYVVTALVAIAGSRILYVVTNLDEFQTPADWFAVRRGGLVAYGGFLGGFLGSWLYLRRERIHLLSWADNVVPSLAAGLCLTRVGCYLFGCDFGKRLSETAPPFLRKIGTFPHWAQGTVESGDGSPAFLRHMEVFRGTPTGVEIQQAQASLPVHPTQIYESLVGLGLLLLLLFARRKQLFRGQQFYLFTFAYGFCRFLLEIIRDDTERGEYGPSLPEHLFLSGALLLFAAAFAYGPSLGVPRGAARTVARVVAFVPAPIAFGLLAPPSFGQHVEIQLSTSQWIAFTSALAVAFFYARDFQQARKNPRNALGIWVDGKPPEGVVEAPTEEKSAAPEEGLATSDAATTTSPDAAASDASRAEGIEASGSAKAT